MDGPGLTIFLMSLFGLLLRISLLLAALICAPISPSLLAPLMLRCSLVSVTLVAVISALITLSSGVLILLRPVPVSLLLVTLMCAVISLSLLISQVLYQLRKAAFRRPSAAAAVSSSLRMKTTLGMLGAGAV